MEDSLITVIVPVYNVERYLKRCVDSILVQTYHNLEIILVDDGSRDSCRSICDEYAQRDKRVVVIHKENGGLSEARNAAIDIAKGKYITFVDSDDYIADDYVEYLYMLMQRNAADIAACGLKKVYSDTDKLDECQENIEVLSGCTALESLLYQRKVTPCAVCKLYRKEIFTEVRYPKETYYEDLATIYKLLQRCGKYVIGRQQKYFYYQRQNSIMNEKFNAKKMQRIQVANMMKETVDKWYPELSAATSARCFLAGIQVFREIPKNGKNKKYIEETWNQIEKYRWSALKNKKAKISIRIMALSTYLGKNALEVLGRGYTMFLIKDGR